MKLYVGNLSFNTTEESLQELFAGYGKVESISLIKDHQTGESKGFGFVEMVSNSDADKAIKALNGHNILGRLIKVNQAENKPAKGRPVRGGRRF
jgi:RNA recognition motif-containing protein